MTDKNPHNVMAETDDEALLEACGCSKNKGLNYA